MLIFVVLGIVFFVVWRVLSGLANEPYKGKRGKRKQKEYIFVKDKESKMKRCQYCGKEISEEEYERERDGYCDGCTEDLMTEEEEDLWGI
ncbi:MAG: hypothetical protein AOA66_1043 [Candidatus Bathyarchaeota archaeon BA2]|nr:MAG: hypothetical protein AOA66_1043 [Candidatus Bathyarchaeota archaeon BA2]